MSAEQDPREKALADYKRKLLQHKEVESKVRALREEVKTVKKEYDKTEDDLKALQSVGQIIGEVLRQLDDERCEFLMPIRHPAALGHAQGLLAGTPWTRLPPPPQQTPRLWFRACV